MVIQIYVSKKAYYMKPKRSSIRKSDKKTQNNNKVLKDKCNIKTSSSYTFPNPKVNGIRKRSVDLSSDDSESTKHNKGQENIPPIATRLRSKSFLNRIIPKLTFNTPITPEKCNSNNSETSSFTSSATKTSGKKRKLSRNGSVSGSLSGSKSITQIKEIFKTPKIHKLTRHRSVLKQPTTVEKPNSNSNRYLLRSRSFKQISFPVNIVDPLLNFFRAPDPPKKPLSEICKRPRTVSNDDVNQSQVSEQSTSSSTAMSVIMSRFIKRNTKLQNAQNAKNWRQRRKFELSQELIDSSSCTSIGEESLNFSVNVDPLHKILDLCEQSTIKSWTTFFDDQSNKTTKKIGEGVYGEVFRLARGNVLKVFAVDGDILVNGEDQMTMDDAFPEIFVSKKLSELNGKNKLFRAPNFVQLKKVTMVNGKLPQVLCDQWNQFKIESGTDNELLDFLPEKQKWLALEYEFAGEPLSNHKFMSYGEMRGIIEQISLSLAVAESAFQFEHRDLHWLNILVKTARQQRIRYRINGQTYLGGCFGIFVTIIDFTVSRMCIGNGDYSNTVYMDMSDCPEIFEGEGDYQFEIYRMMKNDNGNNWREFHPRSNLYWLHYLMDKLLHETSYPRGDPDSKSTELDVQQLFERILSYRSTTELVEQDSFYDRCRSGSHNHCLLLPTED